MSRDWRATIGAVGAIALCWGVAGAVHFGLVRRRDGWRTDMWGLPEGRGMFEFALVAGIVVTFCFAPGLLRSRAPWSSLGLSLGAWAGAVAVLILGQEPRHWIAAAIMAAVGIAVSVANRHLGRDGP